MVFYKMITGFMPALSLEGYSLYICIGALYDTAIVWLQNGSMELPEEFTNFFAFFCDRLFAINDHLCKRYFNFCINFI